MNDNNSKNYVRFNVMFIAAMVLTIAACGIAIAPGVSATPPVVDITHSPANPTTADDVTFVATAYDSSGISKTKIFVDDVKVSVCQDSLCIFDAGQLSEGIHIYYAKAMDNTGNVSSTDTFYFEVAAEEPGPDPDPQPEPTCGVDITGLDVSGNIIYYSIRNTGSQSAYSFGYNSYVITLSVEAECGRSDSQTITHTVFRPYSCTSPTAYEGEKRCDYSQEERLECRDGYWVRISGYYDHCIDDDDDDCTSRYLNDYRCDGDVVQRKYRYSDCDTAWRDWEDCEYDCYRGYCTDDYYDYNYYNDYRYRYDYNRCSAGWECTDSNHKAYQYSDCSWGQSYSCQYGCSNGACRSQPYTPPVTPPAPYPPAPTPYPPYIPTSGCGVSIENLEFSQTISRGSTAFVEFNSRNTGRRSETVTYMLYIDSALKDSESRVLQSGTTYFKRFEYQPAAGQHDIKVVAEAGCGFSDVRLASMVVDGYPSQPIAPSTPPQITGINVNPSQLDIMPFESKVFAIEIKSAVTQSFTIDVSGVESGWLSYPSAVSMEKGVKSVYVYVSPQKAGTYPLNAEVRALSEGTDFSRVVRVYVSPPEGSGSGTGTGQPGAAAGSGTSGSQKPITGLVVAGDTPYVFGILVIVAIVIALFAGKEYKKKRAKNAFNDTEGFAIQDINSESY
jgi:hypothetical protein